MRAIYNILIKLLERKKHNVIKLRWERNRLEQAIQSGTSNGAYKDR